MRNAYKSSQGQGDTFTHITHVPTMMGKPKTLFIIYDLILVHDMRALEQ